MIAVIVSFGCTYENYCVDQNDTRSIFHNHIVAEFVRVEQAISNFTARKVFYAIYECQRTVTSKH